MNFATAGNSIKWKAYLNGTLSETPALDFVSLTYVSTYQSSGYLRLYNHGTTGNPPVAATVFWNATTPSGTTLRQKFKQIREQSNFNTADNLKQSLRVHLMFMLM